MIFIKTLLITAGIFASCTLYFVLAKLFYKLTDCVADKLGYGEWLCDFHMEDRFASELICPILVVAWILGGAFILPYKIASKIFGETHHGF